MTDRRARLLTWIIVSVGLGLAVAAVVMGVARGGSGRGHNLVDRVNDIHWLLSFVLYIPFGALIARRHPRNPVGWLVLAIGVSEIISAFTYEYAARALIVDPGSLPGGAAMAWVSSWSWAPSLCLFSLLLVFFPTGRAMSRVWVGLSLLPIAWMAVFFTFAIALWPHRGAVMLGNTGTFGVPELASFEAVVMGSIPVAFVGLAAGMISIVVRFRRARGIERQQLKLIALFAGLSAAMVVGHDIVLDPLGLTNQTSTLVRETLGGPGVFPIVAAVAMLRYRLFDIDVVINRALVYGSLTAILGGLYVGIVFGMQALLAPVTAESDLAIAASTLAVAALFRPVRSRVQSFIDHRFYRRKVDAQRTVEEFNSHLRDEVDLVAISDKLVDVARDAMQPSHVSLWLRSEVKA